MSLRMLTLQAPYGSFVARGPKTIETRSWSTKYRGRLGIHQGKTWAPGWRGWLDVDDWRLNALDDIGADLNEDVNGSGLCRVDGYSLPLGAIVATAELVDCVPIIGNQEERPPASFVAEYVASKRVGWRLPHHEGGLWLIGVNRLTQGNPTHIEDQRPYGDFTPGRWAWLLDDVKPTTERCPICWGEMPGENVPISEVGFERGRQACPGPALRGPGCDGFGRCQPVPAKGRQGLWSWTPDMEAAQ